MTRGEREVGFSADFSLLLVITCYLVYIKKYLILVVILSFSKSLSAVQGSNI